jgi:hypothetical protein
VGGEQDAVGVELGIGELVREGGDGVAGVGEGVAECEDANVGHRASKRSSRAPVKILSIP